MSKALSTPSEATNALLNLAMQLIEGQDVGAELDQKLSAQIAIVESEIELVPVRAKELGESFLEQNGALFEALISQMYSYHEGLLELGAFFEAEEPDAKFLESGIEMLLETTGDLIELQLAYGQTFAAFGPSRFPMINTLDRLLSEFRKNPDQVEEELNRVLGMMKSSLENNLAQDVSNETGVKEARAGAKKAIEVLAQIKSDYSKTDTHEDLLKKLGEALFDMESGDHELQLSLLEGPTVMPAANLFINTARRAIAGKIPKESYLAALQAYVEFVSANWDAIEAHLEKPIDSAAIQEELPNTMDLVDEHDEIVESLKEVYDEGLDAENFEDCVEELIVLIGAFKESAQVYIDAAGREGKIVCTSCGRGNPRANNVCESCGVSLPKIVDGEQSNSTFEVSEHGGLEDETRMVMTTNIERIFQACEDIEHEKISTEEFIEVLKWADGLLKQMALGLAQQQAELANLGQGEEMTPELEQEQNTIAEVLAFFEEGIDEWDAGLEEMAKYIDEPEKRHLKAGMKRVWEGASAIHRCKIIGDAANQRLAILEAEENEEG